MVFGPGAEEVSKRGCGVVGYVGGSDPAPSTPTGPAAETVAGSVTVAISDVSPTSVVNLEFLFIALVSNPPLPQVG